MLFMMPIMDDLGLFFLSSLDVDVSVCTVLNHQLLLGGHS